MACTRTDGAQGPPVGRLPTIRPRPAHDEQVNFHYHQTSDFDKLEGSTKKRLTRVDQMNYINKLEALILKMPGLSRAKSASRSLGRALLMPQVNPGSRYRCVKRT